MLPPIFHPATLLGVGRPPDELGVVGLALQTDRGDVARFSLSLNEAQRIALALLDAEAMQRHRAALHEVQRHQSSIESGQPNSEGSPPATQGV